MTPGPIATRAGRFEDEGWAVVPSCLPAPVLDDLAAEFADVPADAQGRGGLRNLLDRPSIRALAGSAPIRRVAESILGPGCGAVRGLFFDKTPGSNWRVAWHQDRMIAVRGRREIPGFSAWSEKEGVPHVQPPPAILEGMAAIRLHLDDCGPENGPVRVLPGSHRSGLLDQGAIEVWKARIGPVECRAARGDLLVFRPLLLHASSPAASPARRRVIHLEFAAAGRPGGLDWRWWAGPA